MDTPSIYSRRLSMFSPRRHCTNDTDTVIERGSGKGDMLTVILVASGCIFVVLVCVVVVVAKVEWRKRARAQAARAQQSALEMEAEARALALAPAPLYRTNEDSEVGMPLPTVWNPALPCRYNRQHCSWFCMPCCAARPHERAFLLQLLLVRNQYVPVRCHEPTEGHMASHVNCCCC